MKLKYCRYCETEKSEGAFAERKGTTRSNRCRECQRKFSRQHYYSNKQRYLDRNQEYNAEIKEFIRQTKSVSCKDCKNKFPHYVMDFDHLPEFIKRDGICNMSFGRYNLIRVKEEIAKCEIVCANCHRERTWKRLHK